MRPVGPDVPGSIRALLLEMQDAIRELQTPTKPTAPFVVATAAKLPPAEDYKNCVALVSLSNTLAISTLVVTTWTWLRADGGAL